MASTLLTYACGLGGTVKRASSSESPSLSTVSASSHAGAPNFHPVTSMLFRSGHLEPSSVPLLRHYGIKTIISLEDYSPQPQQGVYDRAWALQNGFRFINSPAVPALWLANGPDVSQISNVLGQILDPANQPVLVHCSLGADRTGIVIAAYRVKVQHWTVDAAVAEMHQMGMNPQLYGWASVLQSFVAH